MPSAWSSQKHVFLYTTSGLVGADNLACSCMFQNIDQWNSLKASFSGGCGLQQPRAVGVAARFRESIHGIGEPRGAPHPCPPLPLAFQPAVSIRAGAGLSVLADSSNLSGRERGLHIRITFQMWGWRFGKDKGKRVRKLNVARNGFSLSAV